MNFIKLNTILSVAFLFLLAGLTSCENEPEVESALFPEDESTHVVKAYIDNYCFYPKNTMQSHLLQLGAGGELSGGDKPVELTKIFFSDVSLLIRLALHDMDHDRFHLPIPGGTLFHIPSCPLPTVY